MIFWIRSEIWGDYLFHVYLKLYFVNAKVHHFKYFSYTDSINASVLETAIAEGAQSVEYTKIVSWLSAELKKYCALEEQVHPTAGINYYY